VNVNYNFGSVVGNTGMFAPAANTVAFATSGGERMRIDSSGNVGIGTASPSRKLQVNGNTALIGTVELSGISGPSAGDTYLCWNSSSGALSYNTGTCTSSDIRLKKNIQPLHGALDKLALLKGVTFDWKDAHRPQGSQLGLIAQDVEKVFPSLVTNGSDGFKSVSYEKLVVPLIEAVKELKADNDNLRATHDSDHAAIEALTKKV
jgi:hypothetical protein